MATKTILELNNKQAKKYFLMENSYSNIGLPTYFRFEPLLKEIDCKFSGDNVKEVGTGEKKLKSCEGVNYKILINQNERFLWRSLELINPVVYVYMVNAITRQDNWQELQVRFKEFQENENIICLSIPSITTSDDCKTMKHKKPSALRNVAERESLEKAIDYSYCFTTEIADCYHSIYTHSIAWSVMGKDIAKKITANEITTDELTEKDQHNGTRAKLGEALDEYVRIMSYGQTNGIPQGSTLMDFIAEIVLGYADLCLTEKIKENKQITPKSYCIIRSRNSYRIFVNDFQTGEQITKLLTETLFDFGLTLNSAQTDVTEDMIKASVEKDKYDWICSGDREELSLRKILISLYDFSKRHPDSLTLKEELTDLFERLPDEIKEKNIPALLTVITEIALDNPTTYDIAAAFISKFVSKLPKHERVRYISKIQEKFKNRPNTGMMEIWLQRLSCRLETSYEFNELLCKLVQGKEETKNIWNFEWLQNKSLLLVLKKQSIIDRNEFNSVSDEICKEEINTPNDEEDKGFNDQAKPKCENKAQTDTNPQQQPKRQKSKQKSL